MESMVLIRNAFMLISLLIFATACATVQERKAFSDWREENRKWSSPEDGDIELPELGETSTLDDYVLFALLNNPGLRASFDRWKAALEKVGPARTLPDPRFTYANYIKEVETRVGPQEHKFGLAQTFPWLGKLDLRGEMALQAAHAEHQRYEAAKLNLIYRVKKIYYEYCYLGQAIEIAKDNVILLTHLESVARAKYKGGAGRQSAVIKSQVELGKLEDRLISLQDSMRPVVAKLNISLNRPAHFSLPKPMPLPLKQQNLSDAELISLLRTENPNLKVFDFMIAREDLAVELAKKDYYPDVTLGVDYIDTASRSDMDPEDNGKDPVIAKVSVNVPIWHRKYEGAKNAAKARRRSVIRERKEKENSFIADLEMALYKLRDADRKISLYRDSLLPIAGQNIKVTQLAFTADKAGFLDLIDSQRILLGFQLDHKRAIADSAQRQAEIEMLTGGDIERKAPDPKDRSSEP
jgi:outer membrane protein TolC